MLANLVRPRGLVLLLLTAVAGCSGGRVTLFAERHTLLESARDVRQPRGAHDLPRELDRRLHPLYVVEPGDVLLIQPADLDSPVRLPGDQPVLPDGTVNLGRFGLVVVAGRTVPEIEALVRETIRAQVKEAGPVSVRLVARQSKVFYVLGEVNSPGAFPLSGRETVLDAILQAGGLTHRASLRDIVLVRPTPPESCRVVLPVCYRAIVHLGDTTTNYQVLAGDRIFVAGRTVREDLFGCRHENAPCGGPQVPCPCPQQMEGARD